MEEGCSVRSEISLTILDVNDNAPSFAFTRFMASVYENAAPKACSHAFGLMIQMKVSISHL